MNTAKCVILRLYYLEVASIIGFKHPTTPLGMLYMSDYQQRIFIIGHHGAGKALLAKTLAEKWGWQFVDADFGLEAKVGRTLSEIAGEQGEKMIYNCQSDILASLINQCNIVVTTDASMVCDENCRKLLSGECIIYLQVSTCKQIERTSHQSMPLLPVDDAKHFFDQLHGERDHLFNQIASLVIDSDDSELDNHVLNIERFVFNDAILTSRRLTIAEKDRIVFHKSLHTPIRLSEQQAACLMLVAQGKTSKEIASQLNISPRTAEGYLAQIMELLGCASSKELIALYHSKP